MLKFALSEQQELLCPSFSVLLLLFSAGAQGGWCLLHGGVCMCWVGFCSIVSAMSCHQCWFQWSSARLFSSNNNIINCQCTVVMGMSKERKGWKINTMSGKKSNRTW